MDCSFDVILTARLPYFPIILHQMAQFMRNTVWIHCIYILAQAQILEASIASTMCHTHWKCILCILPAMKATSVSQRNPTQTIQTRKY
mmetsp:Transcript_22601/g.36258  ORF Transcript_22601/g.36258 Transcript_22601/m.36258 type:complete len:88 (-) Transcript_22601:548-811(-)